jgi:putative hemolysin
MIFLALFVVLTLLNAYFSAMEVAMVSIRPFKMQQIADAGNVRAKKVLSHLKNPEEYLSSIQVGITLVGIVEGLYGGEAFRRYLQPVFLKWGFPLWLANGGSMLIGIGTITYFTIVLGELVPKSLALKVPQKTALKLVPSFEKFTKIFYPFVRLLTWSTEFILQRLKFKRTEESKLTDSDIKSLLSIAFRQGTLEKKELALHQNIFTFYDQTVKEIMTPLQKVVTIKESMSWDEVNDTIRRSSHIYFPIIKENNIIVGLLSSKDFLMNADHSYLTAARKICRVKENDKASHVLIKFQEAKTNFSAVVKGEDELVGIVTIHDIGETLIGEFA